MDAGCCSIERAGQERKRIADLGVAWQADPAALYKRRQGGKIPPKVE
jgi:hypothetical protein